MCRHSPTLRYRAQPSGMFHGTWSVVDVFTGLLGEIGGFVPDCMSNGEADNLADAMNARDEINRAITRSA
jgi:hypothetical protein